MSEKLIFGIDLGGTTTKLAVLNELGAFLDKWEIKTETHDNGNHIINNIVESFNNRIKDTYSIKDFIGVGIGAPGPVTNEGNVTAINIGWENYPVKNELETKLNLPAFVGNDANCAALGELWQGAGKGLSDIVCVTLGTGVGGGVITDGKIVNGISGGAGEIGHISVDFTNGYSCNCGKIGCLETISSATGIVRYAKDFLDKSEEMTSLKQKYNETGAITAKDVFDFAAKNDPSAVAIVDHVTYYLGSAIGTICTILNPSAVIIGGGVSKAGETLLQPVRKYYQQFAFPNTVHDTEILLATLGNDAGVLGAGWLVKEYYNK